MDYHLKADTYGFSPAAGILEDLSMDLTRPYFEKIGLWLNNPENLVNEIRAVMVENSRKVKTGYLGVYKVDDCARILDLVEEGDRRRLAQWLYGCCEKDLPEYSRVLTESMYRMWEIIFERWSKGGKLPKFGDDRMFWLVYRYKRDVVRPVARLESLLPSETKLESRPFSAWDERIRQQTMKILEESWNGSIVISALGWVFERYLFWKFWCAHNHNFTHEEKVEMGDLFRRKKMMEKMGPELTITLDDLYDDPFGIVVRKKL